MENKNYDTAFKVEAIKLVESGTKATDVARELGVHPATIYRWISEFKKDGEQAFPGKGHLKPDDEELRQLRKKVRDLEEENAILKKAAVIFAKHQK